MTANVKRAMAITAILNRLTFNDAEEIRALFSDLIGKKVDDTFLLRVPSGRPPTDGPDRRAAGGTGRAKGGLRRYRRPASMMRFRKACVRSFLGCEKICSGGPSSCTTPP